MVEGGRGWDGSREACNFPIEGYKKTLTFEEGDPRYACSPLVYQLNERRRCATLQTLRSAPFSFTMKTLVITHT